jgi:hypothetical protein
MGRQSIFALHRLLTQSLSLSPVTITAQLGQNFTTRVRKPRHEFLSPGVVMVAFRMKAVSAPINIRDLAPGTLVVLNA